MPTRNSQYIGSKNDEYATTKSNVLKFIQKKARLSKIEKIYDFRVIDWLEDPANILNKIRSRFKSKYVIVRSSALGEDSMDESFAGTYETIQNVKPSSRKMLKSAINSVIKSYQNKGNLNNNNQILIQNQTSGIVKSGVIFSRSESSGKPYYTINYEIGTATDGVTKGKINNVVKIFRKINLNTLPIHWKLLIKSVKEIEVILKNNNLTVEFGIKKNHQIVIFQARPNTISKITENPNIENLKRVIEQNKIRYKKFVKKYSQYDTCLFSDMSDWNPAEIIGHNPNTLDYSLYEFLIMNDVWLNGRKKIGYQNVVPSKLMEKFGNKPYVNVISSFNSMIPDIIETRIKKKLVKFYVKKLLEKPYLHDKIEFEILFSCFDLTLDSRLQELESYNFSKKDIDILKKQLIQFTNEIISDFSNISDWCDNSIAILQKNRLEYLSVLKKTSYNHNDILKTIQNLLYDCKHLGTLQFSTMARIAFIGSVMLRSFVKQGYLNDHFVDDFMNSIKTPLSEFQTDVNKFNSGKLARNKFLKKYGHLRPGTYDVTATRYDQDDSFFNEVKFSTKKPKHNRFSSKKINEILNINGIILTDIDFLHFVMTSLTKREKLKFEFTKNLSAALELLAEFGIMLGITREEISHIDIWNILKLNNIKSKKSIYKFLSKKIKSNISKKIFNDQLILPSIISSSKDFEAIDYFIAHPNFITKQSIIGKLVKLDRSKNERDVEEKIVLLENADPGFDWIFSKNISGLITKYGGVASHMSIRCSESKTPAAIGCGDIFYEKLLNSEMVKLDCKNNEILILTNTIDDEYTEVRKTLKSLGYIR